jgi:hypothetical protein
VAQLVQGLAAGVVLEQLPGHLAAGAPAAMPGSSMTRADSSGGSHWKQATNSPASPASAIARFFGVGKRSQSLARAKSRKAAARSPRLSPRSSALRTGGSRQHRQAESGQHLLSLRVHREACLRSLTLRWCYQDRKRSTCDNSHRKSRLRNRQGSAGATARRPGPSRAGLHLWQMVLGAGQIPREHPGRPRSRPGQPGSGHRP